MDKFCRFCAKEETNFSAIETLDRSISLWLSKIVDLEDPSLPNQMCYTCLCIIEDINFFIEKCIKTHAFFKERIQHQIANPKFLPADENECKEDMDEEYLCTSSNLNEEENDESAEDYSCFRDDYEITSSHERKRINRTFQCSMCSQEFSSNKERSVHLQTHTNGKAVKKCNYKCRFCPFECNDKEKVAFHMKRDHLNNNQNALFKDLLTIVVDQRQKMNENNKDAEIEIEKEQNEVRTSVCDLSNNAGDANIDYIKFLNVADVYECKICNISFCKKNSFNKHCDALHLSDEEKALRRQKTKQQDQHLCQECGKSLPSAFKLEYHIRMHRNDRQYRCTMCPKSYVSKSHLETHLLRHSGNDSIKMYTCDECNKKCRTPSELKIHQRFHRNERPFKCEYCERSFYLKSHLQSHVQGHLSERTYVCTEDGCTQSYRDKNAFRRHRDSHLPNEQKNYQCDICEDKFSTFGIMKDHRRKSHSRKHRQNPLI